MINDRAVKITRGGLFPQDFQTLLANDGYTQVQSMRASLKNSKNSTLGTQHHRAAVLTAGHIACGENKKSTQLRSPKKNSKKNDLKMQTPTNTQRE
jgi:hypothetical protein